MGFIGYLCAYTPKKGKRRKRRTPAEGKGKKGERRKKHKINSA